MITTSYFASRKWKEEDGVSIALFAPKGYKGKTYPPLFPTPHLLRDYKAGRINTKQYIAIYYKETLNILDPAQVAKDLEGKTLLCYERSGSFCHRNLVAQWLRTNGYIVQEL